MTATEASRGFSDLLDAVERGETIRITRGGESIAEIVPARRKTGRDLDAALGPSRLDEDFAREIRELRDWLPSHEGDPWGDDSSSTPTP